MRSMLRAPWQWPSAAHRRLLNVFRSTCIILLTLSMGACSLFSKPEPSGVALPDRRVAWRLHASPSLNTLEDGRSLALLVRIYRLHSPDKFLQAPADTFGDAKREKDALGDDLVSVREVQLLPGQRHNAIETMPRDIAHVGIVALFHRPAAGRWRQAFASTPSELTGIDIGLHACAMTVHRGLPLGASAERMRSAPISCD